MSLRTGTGAFLQRYDPPKGEPYAAHAATKNQKHLYILRWRPAPARNQRLNESCHGKAELHDTCTSSAMILNIMVVLGRTSV